MIALFYNNLEFVISFLLGIISIIVAIYLYYKGLKYQQISYMYQTVNVLSKNVLLDKLSLIYDNKPLDDISITDIIIWCNGKGVINRDDIAPLSPLTIHSSSEILNYDIIYSNEISNNFQIIQNSNDLSINFDYVAKNDGIAIRLIHTGNNNISVTCKIKSGRKTIYVNHRKGYFYAFLNKKFVKYVLSRKLTSFIFIVFTVFLFPIAFIQSANYANNNFFDLPNSSIFMNLDSLIIFILCAFSFFLSVPHIYNLFKNEPPENLLNRTFCER